MRSTIKHLLISSAFALVCILFAARLIFLQFDAQKTEDLRAQTEFTTETQVIQALRGNICDRNGNSSSPAPCVLLPTAARQQHTGS